VSGRLWLRAWQQLTFLMCMVGLTPLAFFWENTLDPNPTLRDQNTTARLMDRASAPIIGGGGGGVVVVRFRTALPALPPPYPSLAGESREYASSRSVLGCLVSNFVLHKYASSLGVSLVLCTPVLTPL